MVNAAPPGRIRRYGAHGAVGAIGQIVVIESLRVGEKRTGRLLHEDLAAVALPYGNSLEIHFKTARSVDDFEFLLGQLHAYVVLTGRAPCLHIECHGGPEGLEFTDGSVISWSRLKPWLVAINHASKMNLFLVLACCYGGYFAGECRFEETAPFAWILGPGEAIYPDPLLLFTGRFYSELLRTRDVTEALTVSGTAAPISYFSMSAVGIFRLALESRLRNSGTMAKFRGRAEKLAQRHGLSTPESVNDIERTLRDMEPAMFARHRQTFFAMDDFPMNESRFSITYAEVLADVEAAERLSN